MRVCVCVCVCRTRAGSKRKKRTRRALPLVEAADVVAAAGSSPAPRLRPMAPPENRTGGVVSRQQLPRQAPNPAAAAAAAAADAATAAAATAAAAAARTARPIFGVAHWFSTVRSPRLTLVPPVSVVQRSVDGGTIEEKKRPPLAHRSPTPSGGVRLLPATVCECVCVCACVCVCVGGHTTATREPSAHQSGSRQLPARTDVAERRIAWTVEEKRMLLAVRRVVVVVG